MAMPPFDVKRTAARDLANLVDRGFLIKKGKTGLGTFYELAKRPGKGT